MKQESSQSLSHLPALTPRFVHQAVGFTVTAITTQSSQPFTSVTTDSRKIQPGCLFVAIPGEKFDGHDFIQKAIELGASGILCKKGTPVTPSKDLHVFTVEDTVEGFRRLAAAWRREFKIPLIVVAGSVGKTTTKEILASLLQGRWPKVLKTQGSQNGYLGIPITLIELRPDHGAAVIEVGIDEIGAMEKHMALLHANASVLTTIGPEHLEKLRDVPTVAFEEGIALSSVAKSGGMVAVNLDDSWIRPHFATLRQGKKLGFTLHGQSAQGEVLQGELDPTGREITVSGSHLKGEKFTLPLLGAHNAGNFLAALTVAVGLGLSADEIRKGLATFKGPEGRSELRELPGKTPVVCDYYNANPTSTEAGIELLTQVAAGKPRWACLADMLELGAEEEKFHRALAEKLIERKIEHVLLFGKLMRALHDELTQRGFTGQFQHYNSHTELATALRAGAKPGDAILIKGSHSMRMEEIWKTFEPFAMANWRT